MGHITTESILKLNGRMRETRGEESSNEHGDSGFATMNKEKRKGIFSFSQSTSGTPPYSPTSTAI